MELLLVDDNPNDRALTRRGLQQELGPLRLIEAETAAEFERALASTRPDIAVIDFSLGWSNGIAVFHRIKSVHPDCGVIMFTGSLGEDAAVDVMRAGVDDYFIKDSSRIPRLASAIRSLADRVADRRARRRSEARHAALLRASSVGVVTCRPDGTLIAANAAACALLDIDPSADPHAVNILDQMSGDRLREDWSASDGIAISGREVTLRSGRSAMLDAHAVPEADGEVECVLTDVTELRNAVHRSELLLREVYHRVYNNLQVMDALLALQAGKHRDPAVREGYRNVAQRLRALALVQQQLHKGEDFESVDFAAYLHDLAEAIAGAHDRPGVTVAVDAVKTLRLPIDRAIPLGLAVTEIVTNAFKHAFPDGREGEIGIALDGSGDCATIRISDNGIGAPADLYAQGSGGGIGALVVPQLSAQAGSSLDVDTAAGTAVTLRLPISGPG